MFAVLFVSITFFLILYIFLYICSNSLLSLSITFCVLLKEKVNRHLFFYNFDCFFVFCIPVLVVGLILWGTMERKKKIEDFRLWRNHLFSVFSDIIFLLCSQRCHNLNGHFVYLEWIYFLSLFLCIPISQTLAVASFLSRMCQDCYGCWWPASTVPFFTEHKNESCVQYTKIFFFPITLFFFIIMCYQSMFFKGAEWRNTFPIDVLGTKLINFHSLSEENSSLVYIRVGKEHPICNFFPPMSCTNLPSQSLLKIWSSDKKEINYFSLIFHWRSIINL